MGEHLSVNEIFFSLQGESTRAGEPCVFVRLAGCDLRCVWCDTEYAFHDGRRMSIDEIVKRVEAYPAGLVEITGGEPLLQERVHLLVERLFERGKEVMVETGGHRDIGLVDERVKLICDVKCPDSGMCGHNRWENLERLRPQDEVKFVLASRADYEWAREQVRTRRLHERNTVLFSPVWATLAPRDLADWILADGLPVRMQLQLHKILWGPDARGV